MILPVVIKTLIIGSAMIYSRDLSYATVLWCRLTRQRLKLLWKMYLVITHLHWCQFEPANEESCASGNCQTKVNVNDWTLRVALAEENKDGKLVTIVFQRQLLKHYHTCTVLLVSRCQTWYNPWPYISDHPVMTTTLSVYWGRPVVFSSLRILTFNPVTKFSSLLFPIKHQKREGVGERLLQSLRRTLQSQATFFLLENASLVCNITLAFIPVLNYHWHD